MKKIAIAFGVLIAILAIFFILVPAFAGELLIDPSIKLGDFEIRWYGVILALAILTGYGVARKNSWKFGISAENVDDYSFWTVIVGVVGARIYHVLFNLDYYVKYPDEIYKVWHGGLSIYGAILLGLAFSYFYSRKKAYNFRQLFDLVALSLPLAQAIGRFGNFINQEAYGTVTDLPWKMYVFADRQFHHPTFLYESILDVLVFFILWRLLGKVKPGILGLSYLLAYSLGRFFIEGIRMDSFYVYGFRVDQVVAFLIFLICGSLLFRKTK